MGKGAGVLFKGIYPLNGFDRDPGKNMKGNGS